jgi:hypothetical protein
LNFFVISVITIGKPVRFLFDENLLAKNNETVVIKMDGLIFFMVLLNLFS